MQGTNPTDFTEILQRVIRKWSENQTPPTRNEAYDGIIQTVSQLKREQAKKKQVARRNPKLVE